MELTLTEMLKVEQAKRNAEIEEKERIFQENHAREREQICKLLPEIESLFKQIESDMLKFDIGVYDYSKIYYHEHYVIEVKYLKYGKYDSCFEQVCIRPLEDGRFEVSNSYTAKKEKIFPKELVERVLKFQSRGTMKNVLYED